MIVTSDVLDSSMQRLAEAAHGLVLSFLAAHGSTCDETPSRPAVEEAAASPMKLSLHLSSPDSDRREQIRRRQVRLLPLPSPPHLACISFNVCNRGDMFSATDLF